MNKINVGENEVVLAQLLPMNYGNRNTSIYTADLQSRFVHGRRVVSRNACCHCCLCARSLVHALYMLEGKKNVCKTIYVQQNNFFKKNLVFIAPSGPISRSS